MVSFQFGHEEEAFLREYYRPNLGSKFYFQPFRTSNRAARWLQPKYPNAGSQSISTRGDIAAAFLHEKTTDRWGWTPSYVSVLRKKLQRDRTGRVPAFWLAVWLFRNFNWPSNATARSKRLTEVRTTISTLGLNDDDWVNQRFEIFTDYLNKKVELDFLQRRYPFMASEIVRQNVQPK